MPVPVECTGGPNYTQAPFNIAHLVEHDSIQLQMPSPQGHLMWSGPRKAATAVAQAKAGTSLHCCTVINRLQETSHQTIKRFS